ncbi:MAG: PTS transporter subunit IIC [Anaerolineales bacterium]|jgi:PTS system galactitol-specific IIC component
MQIINTILDLGPTIMMPIVLFVLAIIFGQKMGKSLRSALMVGIAFIGIFAILNATLGIIGPAVQSLADALGIKALGVDVGWPIASAITWSFSWAGLIIPIGFVVNWIMLGFGWTKTFDADIWNYWHWTFTAAMTFIWTNNLWLAFALAIVVEVVTIKLGDWTSPLTQKYFGIPGTSLPHTETVNWAPFNMAIEKAFLSKIPSLQKSRLDPEGLREKIGIWGEPMMLGLYIGVILGVFIWAVSDYSWTIILQLAVAVPALIFLEGRMIGILIDGLTPIVDGMRDVFQKTERFKDREILIGIDAGPIGLSNPASVVTGMLGIVLYLLLTLVIPGFKILPLGDLAIVPIYYMFAAAASKGNLVKTFINGSISSLLLLALTSSFAEPLTEAAAMVEYALPAGVLLVSSLDVGAHLLPWMIVMPVVGIVTGQTTMIVVPLVIIVLWVLAWIYSREMPEKLAKELDEV